MTSKSPSDGAPSQRAAPRLSIDMEASSRAVTAKPFKVKVLDLSTEGFRIEAFVMLEVGTDIWLRLPGLEPRHATVIWAEGYEAGCAFKQPLHQAVVESIAGR
ncbi:MAG: PilZ domain-containing protein [Sphingomonas sp.]|nr:PilZ domain-containing protein [Sphingomonas sp.]